MEPDRSKEVPVRVAAKLLKCSTRHVLRLRENEELEGTKYGPRRTYIDRASIAEYLARQEEISSEK